MLRLEVSIYIGVTEGCMWCAWDRIGSAMDFSPFAQTQIAEHMHGLGSSLSCTTSMQDMPSFVFIVALVDGHACSCLASDKAANTLPEYHYEVNRCKRRLAAIFYFFYFFSITN